MSAPTQDVSHIVGQQQQQQQHASNFPTQLWSNFTTTSPSTAASAAVGDNNRNNYVNFNQFIMQHNIGNGVAAAAAAVSASASAANSYYPNNQFYNNFYTSASGPVTSSSIDGTTYYANPFATGFDFSASQLHASAPEFVPRFNNLSLNENNNKPQVQQQQLNVLSDNMQPARNSSYNPLKVQDNNTSKTNNNTPNLLPDKLKQQSNQTDINNAESTVDAAASSRQENDGNSNSDSALQTAEGAQSTNDTGRRATGAYSKRGGYQGNSAVNSYDKHEKSRAEREREYDNRRLHNSRRSVDTFYDREAEHGHGINNKYERDLREPKYEKSSHVNGNGNNYERGERRERNDRGGGAASNRGNHRSNRDYQQRYDNNRSNKRMNDWNRNRNGFRVDDKYAQENGKDSPQQSPDKKKNSPRKVYPENEKLSQREKLIRDIELRRLECLVCVEPIKNHQSVWTCSNCYHILHLQCTTKWASSSKSDDGWRCPACQNVLKEIPRDYYCFCGKLKNPPYNRQDVAHTCGEVCARVEGCTHACTLLCHPGPCPPCQANVKKECGCGKTTKIMQCFLKETVECEEICSKLLNCELHMCSAKCHEGKCAPCEQKVHQTCYCNKQERDVVCTRDSHDKKQYSCGKPCGAMLSCENHKCNQTCHAGDCKPCKLSATMVTACPCGKMPIMPGERKSCLDAIPVCEGVCGKTLRCGKAAHPHHCTHNCHLGNCPPCNKQTAVKCRCGNMDQMIKCRQLSTRADDARCKKRCTKKRSCGKHKCNQECCIDIDHICPLPCNYTLTCGKHKCDQPCHRGNCGSCYRSSFEELYCECGAEVIYPPVPCGTKRPLCKKPCSRSHQCEHTPQHTCHSSPTCPPCMMFTTKWCFGKHEQRKTIPCSQESFSCGLNCQKALSCGRHKCIKSCHEGICQAAGEICKQSCTKLRANCAHKCMAPCHDGECPETQCKEMVEVQCECGNRKQMRSCHELSREYSRIATAHLASSMAEMQRGNYMELSEILAPAKTNRTNKTLDCNEECRLLERNRRLAIGLQVRNPDLPQKLNTKYSEFVRNFAKRDPALVKSIHEALTSLVKLAKESKQKSRSHSFPTMNREKRQLVHEMCEMFGVESVAYDAEPNRNVVATAFKDRSWLPAASIMEVLSGMRRVPVPSNNAWGLKR